MKIRCVENSIRYRLRKSDISALQKDRVTSSQVQFGGGAVFKYSLRVGTVSDIEASFDNGVIEILLPEDIFQKWANTSIVSIEKVISTTADNRLHLLVEKDFPCKDREEDISDTFFELNPNENC